MCYDGKKVALDTPKSRDKLRRQRCHDAALVGNVPVLALHLHDYGGRTPMNNLALRPQYRARGGAYFAAYQLSAANLLRNLLTGHAASRTPWPFF